MKEIINNILEQPEIKSLIKTGQERVILSELALKVPTTDEFKRISRLSFLLLNDCFSTDSLKLDNIKLLYTLLKSIDVKDNDQLEQFNISIGIDNIDGELLYYFYLAVVSILSDKIINARIDLLSYSEKSLKNQPLEWDKRVINSILNAFIFLTRKKNGFEDIKKSLEIINNLIKEQSSFEKKYLSDDCSNIPVDNAYYLLGLYHLSKTLTETASFLQNGYNYSNKIESQIRLHSDIAKKLLKKTPRLETVVNVIEVSLKTLVGNSIWSKTSFNDNIKKLCEKKSKLGIIDLLPSQRDAINSNLFDITKNVTILQMPTSAGKSLLAEFNILVTKAMRSDAKIIYIVPSRALVNQVYCDLKCDFNDLGFNIEKSSSTIEIDPNENNFLSIEKVDILVATPEKIDLLIRRKHPVMEDISLFIVDEAHTIKNGARGAKLELLLTLIKREFSQSKFMLLSPFLNNHGDKLLEWLGGGNPISIDWKPAEKLLFGIKYYKTKKAEEIKYNLLSSPYQNICNDNICGSFVNPALNSTGHKDKLLEFSIKNFVEKDKTQLILCYGKGTADKRAQFIYDNIPPLEKIHDDILLVKKYIIDEIGQESTLTKVLEKGICTHHSGLSDETKLLLEHLIRNKHIQYVCSTTSIAEGVNFPISSVFFDDYRKGSHNKLSSNDFWNIAGRAGRTLVDNYGKIILPFNSKANILTASRLIIKSADDLTSVLSEIFTNYDHIISMLENNSWNYLMDNYSSSLAPLVQYFIHIIRIGGHEAYAVEIEDLFKDSFEYHLLNSKEDREKFVNICKTIYLKIEKKYGKNKGLLSFADKTGFSIQSINRVLSQKKQKPDLYKLNSWMPENIFNKLNYDNLTEKIKIIADLKETKIGTESDKAPFNAEIIAKILIAWVNGEKLNIISKIHPHFQTMDDEKRINNFLKKMNDIRFKSSWGLSALEAVVRGDEENITDSYVPSYAYFGVNNEKSLALRMLGLPRELSNSMSQIINKDINNYSTQAIRNKINILSISDWNSLKPKNSSLSGEEWKRITEILIK